MTSTFRALALSVLREPPTTPGEARPRGRSTSLLHRTQSCRTTSTRMSAYLRGDDLPVASINDPVGLQRSYGLIHLRRTSASSPVPTTRWTASSTPGPMAPTRSTKVHHHIASHSLTCRSVAENERAGFLMTAFNLGNDILGAGIVGPEAY